MRPYEYVALSGSSGGCYNTDADWRAEGSHSG